MGGLLGLFMGFSVFSIVEILYFLSIRPYCKYLRSAQKRRETFKQRVFRRFNHIQLKRKINSNTNSNVGKHSMDTSSDIVVFPHIK